MTATITTFLTSPVMIPMVNNLYSTEFYRKPPPYFWWLALKQFPCIDIKPTVIKQLSVLPSAYFHKNYYHDTYDVPSSLVYWVFNNVSHPYYLIFDEETKEYKFYFTDQDEALWFKLMFG